MDQAEQFAGMELIGLRSPHLLARMQQLVRAGGGRMSALATHQIEPIEDCPAALDLLDNPAAFAWAIFASPNAVESLVKISIRHRRTPNPNLATAAPGQQTAQALAAAGFTNIVAPAAEAGLGQLLASGQLAELSGCKVALVQRQAAPPRAFDMLREMQADPVAVECYRRIPAATDLWSSLPSSRRAACNCLLAFDADSLAVLVERAGHDAPRLKRLPLGVHHPQIEAKARQMGFENIITQSSPAELLAQLARHLSS
ncbi:MAG: uroporphyrinogen-III synthase [Betaproteobacteria bacterium]|nr:uroporphyrinogen-III synthase [Betaproteobacteria bacterium]